MNADPPDFPAGAFQPAQAAKGEQRSLWIADVVQLPSLLHRAVNGLTETQLDTKYRKWTIRQIVHHIADSHVNSYIRFKWALTEDTPTIKAYDEGLWSDMMECRTGSISPSLLLLEGLHARWSQLLSSMTPDQFEREFFHPESKKTVSLNAALEYYAWHGKHHLGQILWLLEKAVF